jgi:hypothetical protein
MRGSDRRRRTAAGHPAPLLVVVLLAGALVAGCGTAAVTPSATAPSPSPTPTPDPHLTAPASVGDVFAGLGKAGLKITANNADAGGQGGEPRKRLNTTYAGWPLILSEYSTHAALLEATGFEPGESPRIGDAPFRIVGLNILVEYGPHTKNEISRPEDRFIDAAQALADAMDPLVGPLSQASTVPLDLPAGPVPSAAPSEAPTSAPAASPSS